MSTTLTNGLKLPDKGSVDWYSDMQNNYTILDGAVGTIAEHTTALAGKAPAVHTHTKSDITDLFNSANTWTQTNYFTKDITINSETAANAQSALSGSKIRQIVFNDSNNSNYFFRFRQYVDATSSRMQFNAQGFDSNNQAYGATFVYRVNSDGSSVLYPGDNNQSLGSSSYQWNNVYSKNYFYNGVAWGLDKENTWSKANTFTSILCFQWLSSNGYSDFRFQDQNADTQFILRCYSNDATFSKRSANGSNVFQGSQINFKNNGNLTIQTYDGTDYRVINFTPTSVHPSSSSTQDLGTSTNKWKTLNGVNPGALSLPSGGTTENTDWFNVAGDILPAGGNATDFTGVANLFTPSKDGWLALSVVSCESIAVWVLSLNYGLSVAAPNASDNRQLIIPVVAGKQVEIKVKGARWYSARLIMPKGNV